jgi:uncharacterized delta-60 repeat protein
MTEDNSTMLDYSILHRFGGVINDFGDTDGVSPVVPLVLGKKVLYGMVYKELPDPNGNTYNTLLFKINLDGSGYTVLYTMTNFWANSLTLADNTLYGTCAGGPLTPEVVFKINTDGTGFTFLHVFSNSGVMGEGHEVVGPLTLVRGVSSYTGTGRFEQVDALYGVTQFGGTCNAGIIFGLPINTNSVPVIPNISWWPAEPYGNGFLFNVSGDANTSWTVYSSTDLKNWKPVDAVTLANGIGSFVDSNSNGVPYRFYKLSNGTNCSQAIGFERITALPGYTAIANQLDASPDNTLTNVFTHISQNGIPISLPAGTVIQLWNQSQQQLINYTWNGSGWVTASGQPAGSMTLSPGDFAFIQNNSGTPFTVTFVGLVREGQLTVPLAAGYDYVSSMVPQAGGVQTVLGYNPEGGDTVMRWSGSDYVYSVYIGIVPGYPSGWMDGNTDDPVPEPVIDVGEGFAIENGSGPPETWTQNFSACAGGNVPPLSSGYTEIDNNFNPSIGGIYDVAVQNDGTILSVGDNDGPIICLDINGKPNANFNNNVAAAMATNLLTDMFCIAVDSAHRVYMGGDVQFWDEQQGWWTGYGRLIRLNTNGILDQIPGPDQGEFMNFIFNTDSGQINTISGGGNELAILSRSGGDFSLGGCFNVVLWSSNYNVADIELLDSEATVDSRSVNYPGMAQSEYGNYGEDGDFNGFGGVFSILRTQAGVIVGGDVNSSYGDYGIVNANYNGNNNNLTFSGGADGPVLALASQSGGKILVGGLFSTLGNEPSGSHNYLGRFNADGTVDDTFNPVVDGPVNSILVQSDGKILVGEGWDYFGYGGSGLYRFNADGTLDDTFNIEIDGAISKLVQQPDGKILVAGSFSVTDRLGQIHCNLVKLINYP